MGFARCHHGENLRRDKRGLPEVCRRRHCYRAGRYYAAGTGGARWHDHTDGEQPLYLGSRRNDCVQLQRRSGSSGRRRHHARCRERDQRRHERHCRHGNRRRVHPEHDRRAEARQHRGRFAVRDPRRRRRSDAVWRQCHRDRQPGCNEHWQHQPDGGGQPDRRYQRGDTRGLHLHQTPVPSSAPTRRRARR
jgi:hypothetical protein